MSLVPLRHVTLIGLLAGLNRGKRMVNWCPVSLTALSDEEVIMKEQKGFMYHFKVEVAESIPARSSGRESAQIKVPAQPADSWKGEKYEH